MPDHDFSPFSCLPSNYLMHLQLKCNYYTLTTYAHSQYCLTVTSTVDMSMRSSLP